MARFSVFLARSVLGLFTLASLACSDGSEEAPSTDKAPNDLEAHGADGGAGAGSAAGGHAATGDGGADAGTGAGASAGATAGDAATGDGGAGAGSATDAGATGSASSNVAGGGGAAGSGNGGGATPLCTAGAAEPCVDANGGSGTRTCAADGNAWGACEPAPCKAGAFEACKPKDGDTGLRQCQASPSGGESAWSACQKAAACKQGDSMSCGPAQPGIGPITAACTSIGGVWMFPPWACATPLVLSFDGAPVTFTQPTGSFDLVGVAASHETDWVSAATPWLVLDRNGNGAIDDGSELFGSMTVLASGARAHDGFAALAELDGDGDGAITPADPAWGALRLWSDADQDRASTPRELRSLDAAGVVSIDLGYRVEPRCQATACEMERARFTWRRGNERREGAVVDVHFTVR